MEKIILILNSMELTRIETIVSNCKNVWQTDIVSQKVHIRGKSAYSVNSVKVDMDCQVYMFK